MTIYQLVLNPYSKPRVIGYYTSKTKLVRAIKQHAAELDIDYCEGFRFECNAFIHDKYDDSASEIAQYLSNGWIYGFPANQELE